MNIRYRYIEKSNYFIQKEFNNLNKFIAKGLLISDKIRNEFENKICYYLNEKYGIALRLWDKCFIFSFKNFKSKKK